MENDQTSFQNSIWHWEQVKQSFLSFYFVWPQHPNREPHYLLSDGKTPQQHSQRPGYSRRCRCSPTHPPHHTGPVPALGISAHWRPPSATLHAPCPVQVPPFCAFDFFSWQSLSLNQTLSQANPNRRCTCSGPLLQQNYPTAAQAVSSLHTLRFKLAKSEVNGSAKGLIRSWKYQNCASHPKTKPAHRGPALTPLLWQERPPLTWD